MPNEDGRTLYNHLRAKGQLADDQFTFITGGSVDAATQRFLEEAQVPIIYKPFRIQQLWQALDLDEQPLLHAQ